MEMKRRESSQNSKSVLFFRDMKILRHLKFLMTGDSSELLKVCKLTSETSAREALASESVLRKLLQKSILSGRFSLAIGSRALLPQPIGFLEMW
ncbi:hypothetical protein NPIL_47821 [Nephila pilipes]|uniref:Uncharacterized protein n=1 Tax=Nephila pilipes TaxID=299642 RepID=A0A8X6PCK9_NEPPI|nr:hypothetical protein NPIL_47821 [Nephila pilipes]